MNQIDVLHRLENGAKKIAEGQKNRHPSGEIQGAVNFWKDLEQQWRDAGGQGCPLASTGCSWELSCQVCERRNAAQQQTQASSGNFNLDGLTTQIKQDTATLESLWEDARDADPSSEDDLMLVYLDRVSLEMATYSQMTGNETCPVGGCSDGAVVRCGHCCQKAVEAW